MSGGGGDSGMPRLMLATNLHSGDQVVFWHPFFTEAKSGFDGNGAAPFRDHTAPPRGRGLENVC